MSVNLLQMKGQEIAKFIQEANKTALEFNTSYFYKHKGTNTPKQYNLPKILFNFFKNNYYNIEIELHVAHDFKISTQDIHKRMKILECVYPMSKYDQNKTTNNDDILKQLKISCDYFFDKYVNLNKLKIWYDQITNKLIILNDKKKEYAETNNINDNDDNILMNTKGQKTDSNYYPDAMDGDDDYDDDSDDDDDYDDDSNDNDDYILNTDVYSEYINAVIKNYDNNEIEKIIIIPKEYKKNDTNDSSLLDENGDNDDIVRRPKINNSDNTSQIILSLKNIDYDDDDDYEVINKKRTIIIDFRGKNVVFYSLGKLVSKNNIDKLKNGKYINKKFIKNYQILFFEPNPTNRPTNNPTDNSIDNSTENSSDNPTDNSIDNSTLILDEINLSNPSDDDTADDSTDSLANNASDDISLTESRSYTPSTNTSTSESDITEKSNEQYIETKKELPIDNSDYNDCINNTDTDDNVSFVEINNSTTITTTKFYDDNDYQYSNPYLNEYLQICTKFCTPTKNMAKLINNIPKKPRKFCHIPTNIAIMDNNYKNASNNSNIITFKYDKMYISDIPGMLNKFIKFLGNKLPSILSVIFKHDRRTFIGIIHDIYSVAMKKIINNGKHQIWGLKCNNKTVYIINKLNDCKNKKIEWVYDYMGSIEEILIKYKWNIAPKVVPFNINQSLSKNNAVWYPHLKFKRSKPKQRQCVINHLNEKLQNWHNIKSILPYYYKTKGPTKKLLTGNAQLIFVFSDYIVITVMETNIETNITSYKVVHYYKVNSDELNVLYSNLLSNNINNINDKDTKVLSHLANVLKFCGLYLLTSFTDHINVDVNVQYFK